MIALESNVREPEPESSDGRKRWSPAVVATIGSLLAGLFVVASLAFVDKLPILLAFGVMGLCGIACLRWPDLTVPLVIGLMYSNLAVVAVRFHGVPNVVTMLVPAMLGWPFFYRFAACREPLRFGPATPYLFAFIAVQAVSALLCEDPAMAFGYVRASLLEGAALYLLVVNAVRTRRLLRATLWTLALAGMLMGGVPLLKQLSGETESEFGGLAQADSDFAVGETAVAGTVRQQRASGTIGEQNRFSQVMVLLVPLSLALLWTERSRWRRWAAGVATLLALAGTALAFSRGTAIGFATAVGIAVCCGLLHRRHILGLVIGTILVLAMLPAYLARLTTPASLQSDNAVRGRVTEMIAAAMVFRDHMLIGVGPGRFPDYAEQYGQLVSLRPLDGRREAHSLPLSIASETGVLGLIAFGSMLVAVIVRLFAARRFARSHKDTTGFHFTTGALLAVILYLTTGLFLHFSFIRYFWLIIGLADSTGQIVVRGDQGKDLLPGPEILTSA